MKNKILFLGLASSYTEGMTYQDNYLNKVAVERGYDVLYISNAEKFENGKMIETDFEDITSQEGYRLIRVKYINIINKIITKKIKAFKGTKKIIYDFSPDIIYCHSFHFLPMIYVVRYIKKHKKCKLYIDSHVDGINSAHGWLSLNILHKLYYKKLLHIALPYVEKFFYVTESVKQFSMNVYKTPIEKMSFFPLGAFPINDNEYSKKRNKIRKELKINSNQLLFVHSGKIDKNKKTKELLEAFYNIGFLDAKLIIIGSIDEEYGKDIYKRIDKDMRVEYLGWKSGNELNDYLCAADLYCQPGSVSATLQNAICHRCPCLAYPDETYKEDLDCGNFLWAKSKKDIEEIFSLIGKEKIDLSKMSKLSEYCAKEKLDYRKNTKCIF